MEIQPFDLEYVINPYDLKPMKPGTEIIDIMDPNKIIGYRTPLIDDFMRGSRMRGTGFGGLDTISTLGREFQGHILRDFSAYKLQLKMNEVIGKLNEVSEKNKILEERIVHLERQTIGQNQHNSMRRLTNVRERLRNRNRTNRRRNLSREQGQAIAENILAVSN